MLRRGATKRRGQRAEQSSLPAQESSEGGGATSEGKGRAGVGTLRGERDWDGVELICD